MDQWLLAVTSDPAAKGSAKDLEVAGAGPVHCRFSIPPSFLTMCSSERCLSLASPWYIDHLNQGYKILLSVGASNCPIVETTVTREDSLVISVQQSHKTWLPCVLVC